jgi:hypothetical protein
MAPGSASATGGQLVEELRRDLADIGGAIRSHHFLAGVEARVPEGRLRAFAGEQSAIVASDRHSFAFLAGPLPGRPGRRLLPVDGRPPPAPRPPRCNAAGSAPVRLPRKGSRWCAPGLKGNVLDRDQLVVAAAVGKGARVEGPRVSSSA